MRLTIPALKQSQKEANSKILKSSRSWMAFLLTSRTSRRFETLVKLRGKLPSIGAGGELWLCSFPELCYISSRDLGIE